VFAGGSAGFDPQGCIARATRVTGNPVTTGVLAVSMPQCLRARGQGAQSSQAAGASALASQGSGLRLVSKRRTSSAEARRADASHGTSHVGVVEQA
jgi:hypothetical protein